MGCDIHSYAERKSTGGGGWEAIKEVPHPFSWRSYRVFAFLAGVRNYSAVTPISQPRRFPTDASPEARSDYELWGSDAHTPSWLTVKELNDFDYTQQMEDWRCGRQITPRLYSEAETCDPGEGIQKTYQEFLGDHFFKELDKLNGAGAERVVFWFDN